MAWENILKENTVWLVGYPYEGTDGVFTSEEKLQAWIRKAFEVEDDEDIKDYYNHEKLYVRKLVLDKEPPLPW